jgi:hypothetical protein
VILVNGKLHVRCGLLRWHTFPSRKRSYRNCRTPCLARLSGLILLVVKNLGTNLPKAGSPSLCPSHVIISFIVRILELGESGSAPLASCKGIPVPDFRQSAVRSDRIDMIAGGVATFRCATLLHRCLFPVLADPSEVGYRANNEGSPAATRISNLLLSARKRPYRWFASLQ